MLSEKPKTQRLPKKKPQEEALKQSKLKQLAKPQPEPKNLGQLLRLLLL